MLPSLDHLPVLDDLADLSAGTRTLTLAASAVALAIVLTALQTRLYRLLEGYSWPQWIQDLRRSKQLERKYRIKQATIATRGLEGARLREQYSRFLSMTTRSRRLVWGMRFERSRPILTTGSASIPNAYGAN